MSLHDKTPHPFIIWTLRRTGGTNLTQRLVERSGLPSTEHEPFNKGRVYGDITEQWQATGDRRQLKQSIEAVCQRGEVIKHCVEVVPWEVTQTLAKAANRYGYRHLFLYRKNPLDRLLSLHYAKLSGVWGPGQQGDEAALFEQPLPVDELVSHERRCLRVLSRTWNCLTNGSSTPRALAFEALYQALSAEAAADTLLPLLEYLHLEHGAEADRTFVDELLQHGNQGTRDRYARFQGRDALAEALATLPSFNPEGEGMQLKLTDLYQDAGWVMHAAVDTLPLRVVPNRPFDLAGVLVTSDEAPEAMRLSVIAGDAEYPVNWGIRSPKMAGRYPQAVNGQHARFKVSNIRMAGDTTLELVARDRSRNTIPLFRVSATGCPA